MPWSTWTSGPRCEAPKRMLWPLPLAIFSCPWLSGGKQHVTPWALCIVHEVDGSQRLKNEIEKKCQSALHLGVGRLVSQNSRACVCVHIHSATSFGSCVVVKNGEKRALCERW